jgi:hypothetical protein
MLNYRPTNYQPSKIPTAKLPTTKFPTLKLLTLKLPTTKLLTAKLLTVKLPTVQLPTYKLPTISPKGKYFLPTPLFRYFTDPSYRLLQALEAYQRSTYYRVYIGSFFLTTTFYPGGIRSHGP